MKVLGLLLVFLVTFLFGCNKTSPVMQSITPVICDAETALTTGFATNLTTLTGAKDANACGQALLTAMGNANFCQTPLPQPAPTPAPVSQASKAKYATIGDIPISVLHPLSKDAKLKSQDAILGAVGQVACPLGDGIIVGLFTGGIPVACQGPNSLTSTALNQTLILACEGVFAGL